MRGNRAGAIAAFFENLAAGDPVAWGIVGFFVLLAAGLGLVMLKIRRDQRREDEARDRRRGYRRKEK